MFKSRRYICILLTVLLSLSLFGCGRKTKTADAYTMKNKEESVAVSSGKINDSIYYDNTKKEKLKKISTTDMLTLYYNEEKKSISLYDSGAEKLWRGLPSKYNGEETGLVSITLLSSGNEYELFPSHNAENKVEYTEKGVKITFDFTAETESGDEIGYSVPVEFTDNGGMLVVTADCSKISQTAKNKNTVIKSINLLPFFGAFYGSSEGDYLVIPDGCGALIYPSQVKGKSYETKVYGSDPSLNENKESSSVLPVFGIKHGSGAVAAVITDGDAIAEIKAETEGKKGGFNRVYPSFDITPVTENEDGTYLVSKKQYSGILSVSYRFLSKDSADYIGIAGACRELLIRNSELTTGNINEGSDYPFNLSIIGAAPVTDAEGKIKHTTLTDYSQCLDIIESLKAKDINRINLRYKGILDGGALQKDIENASLSGKNGLSVLTDYALKTDVTVFTDIYLLSAGAESGFSDYAVNLFSDPSRFTKAVLISNEYELTAAKTIKDKTKAMLSEERKNGFEGICLSDTADILYSDFSSGEVMLRNETAELIKNQMGAVAATKTLMAEKGNLYGIKYAEVITNLPSSAFYSGKGVTEIPLTAAVLHGILDYSFSPVNNAKNSTKALLKCAEYGAVPSFEWYALDLGTEEESDSYYYMNSVSDAQNSYVRLKNAFSDLRTERITDHKNIRKNVYMTQFGSGTKIYVNYGKKPVTVSGVTIEAESFIRVN
ncbi:MAG: DUF5696 domain-containing protein [Acutalibacteraceae bacterium]|nr:DUF5696 domain-containing protein [Acutalibacteraceae bacterium]